MRPASIPYRPEVDGLRAIAVLMVLLFHCGFTRFKGGFAGVDVFFVISGYLITSLILADLQRGTFDFVRFYARRIRRLVPALLATVVLTLIAACIIMSPEHLAETARSGMFAVLSVSNFYFAMVTKYFDPTVHERPFLHTWSLGVEEQYYLFWPAALFVLYRYGRKWMIPAVVLAGVPIGIALSEYWVGRNPNHAYFLLPFRAFQLLMGAACVWLTRVEIPSRIAGNSVWLVGVAIIFATSCLYSEATPFPGLWAMVPSLGAVLVIWQGGQVLARRTLGSPILVWLGRISYSTYLIHWPIVVFWWYLSITPIGPAEKYVLLALCLLGGQLLHVLIEQRFRHAPPQQRSGRHAFGMGLGGAAAATVLSCGALIATQGWAGRMKLVPEVEEYRQQSLFGFQRGFGDGILRMGPEDGARVLIFGDSMAQNYVPAILKIDAFRNARVDIVTRGGCVLAQDAVLVNFGSPDDECRELRRSLYELAGPYDVVIWAQNWLGYGHSLHWEQQSGAPVSAFPGAPGFEGWKRGIDRTLVHFSGLTNNMVLFGPPVAIAGINPVVARIGPVTDVLSIPETFGQMHELVSDDRESMERSMRKMVAHRSGVHYIDPRSVLCGPGGCELWSGKYSNFMDELHNTSAAADYLALGLERLGLGVSLGAFPISAPRPELTEAFQEH